MTATSPSTPPGWCNGNVLGAYGRREPLYELVQVPEAFGPVRVTVDADKVKQFAYVTDDYRPWHFSSSPFGRPIAHAALLANDLLQLFTLTYDPSRVVGLHTEEMLWFASPLPVGEPVVMEGSYVEKFVRRGQGYVVMVASAKTEDGRTVLRHRGWEIMRTMPGEIAGRRSAPSGEHRVQGQARSDLPFVREVTSQTPLGTPLEPLEFRATPSQVSLFSRIGEYVRNIHNDMEKAREAGLPWPIAQGQLLVCLISRLMTRACGATWFTSGFLHVKFLKPVPAGEVITIHGCTSGPGPDGAEPGEVSFEVWARNSQGEMAAVGWARGRPARSTGAADGL